MAKIRTIERAGGEEEEGQEISPHDKERRAKRIKLQVKTVPYVRHEGKEWERCPVVNIKLLCENVEVRGPRKTRKKMKGRTKEGEKSKTVRGTKE